MQQINEIRNAPVSQFMTREVATIDGSQTVSEAIKIMRQQKISSVVVNPRNQDDTWGIVTERDILSKVVDPGEDTFKDIWNTKVHEIMSKPVISIGPALRVKYAIRMMHKMRIRRLLVLEGTKLSGIISETNILHAVEELPVHHDTAL